MATYYAQVYGLVKEEYEFTANDIEEAEDLVRAFVGVSPPNERMAGRLEEADFDNIGQEPVSSAGIGLVMTMDDAEKKGVIVLATGDTEAALNDLVSADEQRTLQLEQLEQACIALLDAPHHDHFTAAFAEEMAAIERMKRLLNRQ